LQLACEEGHVQMVEVLLLVRRSDLQPPCCRLAELSNSERCACVALPCREQAGAAVDSRNADGATALHLAAQNGCRRVIELLLTHNACPDARDSVRGSAQGLRYVLALLRLALLLSHYR
jgi:ankyrin repeat protein